MDILINQVFNANSQGVVNQNGEATRRTYTVAYIIAGGHMSMQAKDCINGSCFNFFYLNDLNLQFLTYGTSNDLGSQTQIAYYTCRRRMSIHAEICSQCVFE